MALGRDAGRREARRANVAGRRPLAFEDTAAIRAMETYLAEAVAASSLH